MYATFFGLTQDPFSIAPDPHYLFMSERHREALAHLLYGLKGGGGFVLLSGEIGTGKTTVCRCFLEQIPAGCNVAYIFNPKLTTSELLHSICDEFHVALPPGATTAKELIDPLNGFLLATHAAGQNNVLIIDEAQNLSPDVLEQLRLLTNLETNERKLLQIVLIGQPELRRMLGKPELEQLEQRVIARFHLDALSLEETSHYIAHRLAVAGLKGASPFNPRALARIHKLSRGIPRRINLLCGRALLGAYAGGIALVNRRTVDKAADEVFGKDADRAGPKPSGRRWRAVWPLTAIVMSSVAGLLAGAAWLPMLVRPGPALAPRDVVALSPPVVPAPSSVKPVVAKPVEAALPSPLLTRAALESSLSSSSVGINQAWQRLGKSWGLTIDDANACQAAMQQGVYCFASPQASLSLIRELDRPGLVTLLDSQRRPVPVLLLGLTAQTALLHIETTTQTVSLTMLAEVWRGDFSTFWRAPPGYSEKMVDGKLKPATDWLLAQLAKQPGATAPIGETGSSPDALASRQIRVFQLAHGLNPDGRAGRITLMQLNRATGVTEPHLSPEKL